MALGPGLSQKDPQSYIDTKHHKTSHVTSPHGKVKDCAHPLYITVDLQNYYQIASVTIYNCE